jgi:hypothetical protein
MWTGGQARALNGVREGRGHSDSGESRAVVVALLWFLAFAVAELLLNRPQFMPTVPGTDLRLISVPMALFALALMLRPSSEAPLYALVYVLAGVWHELGATHFDFVLARIAIETFQTVILVCVTLRYFWPRLGDPLVVGMWAIATLLITATGAALMVGAARMMPMDGADYVRELGGDGGMAWRYWWLGSACSYMTFGAPAAALVTLRHRVKRVLATPGWERRRFVGLILSVVLVSLFAFPAIDMSWLGLPPDISSTAAATARLRSIGSLSSSNALAPWSAWLSSPSIMASSRWPLAWIFSTGPIASSNWRSWRMRINSEKPRIALSGVRSSWLSMAMKRDFIWLASSASLSASFS